MKIGLLSLGCPKNLVDSEVMLGLAQQAGHDIVQDAASADVLVVNTCAFIDQAKQESVNAILEMAAQKTDGRCQRLIVTGCLAERYRDELTAEIPEIDVVLGTGEVPAIVRAIEGPGPGGPERVGGPSAAPVTMYRRNGASVSRHVAARHREALAGRVLPTYIYDARTPRLRVTPRHFAYVKVAEGCDYNCSFCIIPTLRGQYRSRPIESLVDEVRQLAAEGVREVILISQDTTFYGIDRGERGALARLLRALDPVEGLERIRLLYLYPTTVTDDVLEAMATLPKVCKYVDLPLQHSAESVLARMRRPGNRLAYERLLARIRERVPGVALRTTLIVGFPGESREEFEDLVGFVRAVEFDHLGVFTYSHEEGTAAAALADDVAPRVKRQRQRRLMTLQQRIVERRQRGRIGTRTRVLVDGPSPEHELVVQARLDGQAPEIDPVVYLTECDPATLPAGTLLEVEIVGARGYDLVARPLSLVRQDVRFY
jgi:ribosomal protein S12 methylthiotransferase